MTLPPKSSVWTVAAVFLVSTATFFRVPLLPEMGKTLAMDASLLGVFTALFAVGRLLVDLPAGALLDRVGTRPMFALSGLLLLAGSAVIGLAGVPALLLAGAVVLGIASAGANTTGQTFFARNVEGQRRGRSMALFSAALLGGQTVGPAVAGGVAAISDWRVAMLGAAALGLVVALGAWVAHRGAGAADDQPPDTPAAEAGSADDDGDDEPVDDDASLQVGSRGALYAARFSALFLMGAIPQTLVPIIGADNLGLTVGVIGAALGAGGVARFVAAFVGGQLADRLPRKVVMVSGMSIQVLGVALLALEGAVLAWLAAIVLLSLGSFAMVTGTTILGDHVADRHAGKELGAYRFIGDLGLLAGPAAGAALFDVAGQRVAVLAVAALLAAAAVAGALLLPHDPHREPADA